MSAVVASGSTLSEAGASKTRRRVLFAFVRVAAGRALVGKSLRPVACTFACSSNRMPLFFRKKVMSRPNASISIAGSSKIISEFFCYAVQSILWQRGVYPEDTFERKHEYDTVLQVSKDPKLRDYLANVLAQVENWAAQGTLQQLVMVIAKLDTHEPMERWVFNVETEQKAATATTVASAAAMPAKEKTGKEMRAAIGAIMRQISSSVTYLPLLEDRCSFDLLVYTDKKAAVPITWENSDPHLIQDAQQVKLRGFATDAHRIDASVAYRVNNE